MTPLAQLLAAEIESCGPISFRRFMEAALYHPLHGYYRRARDPFGKQGDFFTAEQIQPVFGILIAERIRQLHRAMGEPSDFTVVELGPGRGEMAPAFSDWRYLPLDVDAQPPAAPVRGVVFSNEFFDALPVEAVTYRDGAFRRQMVSVDRGSFVWQTGEPVDAAAEQYLRAFFPPPEEGRWYEANLAAVEWLERAATMLTEGYIYTIDYGFTRAESVRFPAGTLMGYRRHTAREDVLNDPGERDITAHVNFTALQESGARCGLQNIFLQTLSRTLLDAGEPDQFAAALGGGDDLRRRMQLKTLLFGMGETFRVLLQRKEENRRE